MNNISENVMNYITVKEASKWASDYTSKKVTNSNVIYLVNYGKIANKSHEQSKILIDKNELKVYYDNIKEKNKELNSPLSFAKFKEAETTKHIHRLHPYKGKFIPQLVEYFLDDHIDNIKKEVFFEKGNIILDPFCGSGTTLSVANELYMHGIGIDISAFNTMLSNAKIVNYDIDMLEFELDKLTEKLNIFNSHSKISEFEHQLNLLLSAFNDKYFPTKTYKRAIVTKEIDEYTYSKEKLEMITKLYNDLVKKYKVDIHINLNGGFLNKWYLQSVRDDIAFVKNEIQHVPKILQEIIYIILSRTARSCRATTHSDLATLIEPINSVYYCKKHGRICKPLFSINKWFKSYSKDTIKRIKEFSKLKTNTEQLCINADSSTVDLISKLKEKNIKLADMIKENKIDGIFTSPPYIGMIDYHEQHAYAYDIIELERNDELEIGKLKDGQSRIAKENYIHGISSVLTNMKKYLKNNYKIFLVANDKYDLYPKIADLSGMYIEHRYERPVINRTEKDQNKYNETIFYLRDQNDKQ